MTPADVLLSAFEHGAPIRADGERLHVVSDLPDGLRGWAMHWRRVLWPLVALPVATLCHGMTDDEREAFEERAAILETDGGYPRELAERVALWWTRTPRDERERIAA